MEGKREPLKDTSNVVRELASNGSLWSSGQAPKLLSQLAAKEHENKKLKGELKRRKTDGRTVMEMESETSYLRKELEFVKNTSRQDLASKVKENEALKGTIADLQAKMQADLADFQSQVESNKHRQAALVNTLREFQDKLNAKDAEAVGLDSAIREGQEQAQELQKQVEHSKQRAAHLEQELNALNQELRVLKQENSTSHARIRALEAEQGDWQCSQQHSKAESDGLKVTLQKVQRQWEEAEDAKRALEEQVQGLQQEMQVAAADVAKARQQMSQRLEEVEAQHERFKAEAKQAKTQAKGDQAEVKRLKAEVGSELEKLQGEVERLRREQGKLASEKQQLKKASEALTRDVEGQLRERLLEAQQQQKEGEKQLEAQRQQMEEQCAAGELRRKQQDAAVAHARWRWDVEHEEMRLRVRHEHQAVDGMRQLWLQQMQSVEEVQRRLHSELQQQKVEAQKIDKQKTRAQLEVGAVRLPRLCCACAALCRLCAI